MKMSRGEINEFLETLPGEKQQLIATVEASDMEASRKTQAVSLLKAIGMQNTRETRRFPCVEFEDYQYFFSYEDCSIEKGKRGEIASYKNKLIADINKMSAVLKIWDLTSKHVPDGLKIWAHFTF